MLFLERILEGDFEVFEGIIEILLEFGFSFFTILYVCSSHVFISSFIFLHLFYEKIFKFV